MQKEHPLVAANIRAHLIPFLFKEFEGEEAQYMGKTVKRVSISPLSSVGKFVYSQMDTSQKLGKKDKFILFLSIIEKSGKIYKGILHVEINKVKQVVLVSEKALNAINNFIEDVFRVSFVYYVDGSRENGDDEVIKSIDKFIAKYDLLEFGFSNNTLRTLYYREKSNNSMISRMQHFSITNRVMNFSSM